MVTDSSGEVAERFEYEPFGLVATSTGPLASGAHRFTGKPEDGAIGLYYFGARYYDPEVGRFTSRDPAKDGLNWYVYCINNPLNRVDFWGLHSVVYSHDEKRIYWVDDDGFIVKSWECRNAIAKGVNEKGQPRAPLPNGEYVATASKTGGRYGSPYGTFYIDTGDPRGRDIHGGGSGSHVLYDAVKRP